MTNRMRRLARVALITSFLFSGVRTVAAATDFLGADEGKLHLTAGFNDVDGAGGAGLVPLAFISGYGSRTVGAPTLTSPQCT